MIYFLCANIPTVGLVNIHFWKFTGVPGCWPISNAHLWNMECWLHHASESDNKPLPFSWVSNLPYKVLDWSRGSSCFGVLFWSSLYCHWPLSSMFGRISNCQNASTCYHNYFDADVYIWAHIYIVNGCCLQLTRMMSKTKPGVISKDRLWHLQTIKRSEDTRLCLVTDTNVSPSKCSKALWKSWTFNQDVWYEYVSIECMHI